MKKILITILAAYIYGMLMILHAGAGGVKIALESRTVFQRMEEDATVELTVRNAFAFSLRDLQGEIFIEDTPLRIEVQRKELDSENSAVLEIPLDTSLKPGEYTLRVRFNARARNKMIESEAEKTISIVPIPPPHEMPVVLWGYADIDVLKGMGFTHSLFWLADHERVWQTGKPVLHRNPERVASDMDTLDESLAAGLKRVGNIRPGRWIVSRGKKVELRRARFRRINRDGRPYNNNVNVCGLFPEVQQFCYAVGKSIGRTYGGHPAFDGAMIHTEIRGGTRLCFHDHDKEVYNRYAGRPIPEDAVSHRGIPSDKRNELVPSSGIVADDLDILDYYRWFWRYGDGWNALHSQAHRGLQEDTHEDFWTFHDPAVRCPAIWGSGGEVDILSHWTYTNPDPPRIGLAADELFAMAEGRPGQEVKKMTQAFWYRSQVAPELPERDEDRTEWEKEEPEAEFITVSPDHLRAAFWLKIARPVRGIMYHGIGSLVEGNDHSYRYTHPETSNVLAELIHEVVKPLGASLIQIPDPEPEVAMLESFTSDMFGASATWGWGRGWVADMHHLLQWARLQPKIVYEDTILRDGLDNIKILVMPNCPVLPERVYERISDFQERGGIIVGDERLASALEPDILINSYSRTGAPDEDKKALQELAEDLRRDLAPKFNWRADSSDPDIIVRRRAFGDTHYLFAINDKRTYGEYVGQHRKVMEKGLENSGLLSFGRRNVYVYDLLDNKRVRTRHSRKGTEWKVRLEPGGGKVYMITRHPLTGLKAGVARRRSEDREVKIQVRAVSDNGQPFNAVVPMEVKIIDPSGTERGLSGFYGAKEGTVTLDFKLAANDKAGTWSVRAREMATNKTAKAEFNYRR